MTCRLTKGVFMEKVAKLTPDILKKIIQEERTRLKEQQQKVEEAKRQERIDEVRKELKVLLQLLRERKVLTERIKAIQKRAKTIKNKLKEA
jgi:DNA repair exonuclease SbcCD ATPase subunit